MPSRDPEVAALTASIRSLVKQAHALLRMVDETVTELEEYAVDVSRNRGLAATWNGVERRGHPRD